MSRFEVIDRSPATDTEDLKQQLNLGDDDSFDIELERYILAAEDYVSGLLGYPIGRGTVRTYSLISGSDDTYTDTEFDRAMTPTVKQAVLMVAAELFEARSDTTEKQRYKVSLTASRLLNQYRRVNVG